MVEGSRVIEITKFMTDRFSKKAATKNIYQKLKNMSELEGIKIWEQDRVWLSNICDYLGHFEDQSWSAREFRILYEQHVTKPITIYDYFRSCILDDSKQLFFSIKNIYSRFIKSNVYILSIRDILEYYESDLAEDNKNWFTNKDLIETPHRSKEDVAQHSHQPPSMNYGEILPDFLSREDFYYLFARMGEIRKHAKYLIDERATISLTHIVISAYLKCKNNKNVMIITASNTYKDRLKIFSEMPIVTRECGFIYYGDISKKPSTEAVPHWVIHSRMSEENDARYKCIVHIHNEQMTTMSENSEIKVDSVFIPTIPHYDYGTEEIGGKIFEAIRVNNTFGVSVKAHGQWFVGENFRDLSQKIISLSTQLKKKAKAIDHPGKRKIFISSTCHDLKDIRAELFRHLEKLGYFPILSEDEDFPVKLGVDKISSCIEAVKQSDCFILIIGTKYGEIIEGEGISYTQKEYQAACDNNIPRINFCLESVWNLARIRGKNPNLEYPEDFDKDREKIDKLFDLLDRVRNDEKDDWIHPFKTSVELKRIVEKRLKSLGEK